MILHLRRTSTVEFLSKVVRFKSGCNFGNFIL